MSMVTQVKNAGGTILALALIIGLLTIGIALLTGAAWFSMWVLKWTFPLFAFTLLLSVALLAPLSFIPPTRGISAIGFTLASLAFGAILWVWGMAYTYSVWGIFGVIIGLVLLGVGVVPVAMFAALLHGDWPGLGVFLVACIVTVGSRALGNWLGEKAEERSRGFNRARITVPAFEILE